MKRLLFFCRCLALLLLQPATLLSLTAQPLQNGAYHGAFADASVGLPDSHWGSLNPAAPGSTHAGMLALHTTRTYGLAELNFMAAQLILPVGGATILLNARQLTFSAYTETLFEAGFTTTFSPGTTRRLSIGLLGTGKRTGIQQYGSDHLYAATIALQLAISHNLYLGVVGRHFVQSNLSKSTSTLSLPKSLAIGLAYQPVAGVWLMGAHIQEQFFKPSLRLGIELSPAPSLRLRGGISSDPVKYSLGAGFRAPRLIIDLAAERHVVLGWSPGLSINVVFMRPKDE